MVLMVEQELDILIKMVQLELVAEAHRVVDQ
jgi:hypothetical protein